MLFEDRLREIRLRYGPDHAVTVALDSAYSFLAACCERTMGRWEIWCNALTDVGFGAVVKVVLDAELNRGVHLIAGNFLGKNEPHF